MAHTRLRWISTCSIAFGLLVGTGCGKEDDGDDGNAEDTSGGEDDSTASGATATASNTGATATTTTASTTVDPSTDSGDDTMGTFEDSGTTDPVEPQPDGAMCTEDAECISGHCFVVGILGGLCGECNTDADCADTTMGGCTIPNPLAQPPQGAVCNTGEHGAGCMGDEVCMDPFICAEILNVPGVLVASTCSECTADADCGMDLCSPSYDVLNLSGSKDCVMPGSVPDGGGCDFEGSGDMACESGHCAIADVMGLLQLGVCSPCEVDADCMMGETCDPPSVDLATGLVAGACVPM